MRMSPTVSPRRVTTAEEGELLAAAQKITDAKATVIDAIADRDQLIAELIEHNARISDIAEILQLSHKAIRDARDRAASR